MFDLGIENKYWPKAGEPLKEHPEQKDLRVIFQSSSDRSTDKEGSPSPKRWSKKLKKRRWSRKKIKKKEKIDLKNQKDGYSSSTSPSSSSNDNSDESKYRNNEGKENTDSRFRVVSDEDQYKYSLPPDMTQDANVNFDTYIKEADLIMASLIKNPVPENICAVKTLDDFVKDILKDKKK